MSQVPETAINVWRVRSSTRSLCVNNQSGLDCSAWLPKISLPLISISCSVEADAQRGVAVFSIARLLEASPSTSIGIDHFRRRAATEAIHELGHTYGLGHCDNPRCVMWFSNTLSETDRKGTEFCPAHQAELAEHQ